MAQADEAQGWLYDGVSAIRQEVALALVDGRPVLRFSDGRTEPLDGLTAADVDRDSLVYRRAGRDGWQLTLPRPLPDALKAALPRDAVYGRWIDRIGLGPAVAAGLAVSLIVLAGGAYLPQLLAPLVPRAWERNYGNALVGDFGGKYCAGPGGQQALNALAARLRPGARDFDVRVVDIPIVNAAALPGGHIVIFRELLAEADGPDEVAGVLGHEIAHVEHRDVTEAMIRELGFGLVIASLGGTTGGNANAMLATRYGRDAESDADRAAIATLAAAGISPRPTAGFFARLAKQEKKLGRLGDALGYISTHPTSAGRQARFHNAARPRASYAPALSEEQWNALVDICHNDPKRRKARRAGA